MVNEMKGIVYRLGEFTAERFAQTTQFLDFGLLVLGEAKPHGVDFAVGHGNASTIS